MQKWPSPALGDEADSSPKEPWNFVTEAESSTHIPVVPQINWGFVAVVAVSLQTLGVLSCLGGEWGEEDLVNEKELPTTNL